MVLPSHSDFGVPRPGILEARHEESPVEPGIHFVYNFAIRIGICFRKPPEPLGKPPKCKDEEWIFQG